MDPCHTWIVTHLNYVQQGSMYIYIFRRFLHHNKGCRQTAIFIHVLPVEIRKLFQECLLQEMMFYIRFYLYTLHHTFYLLEQFKEPVFFIKDYDLRMSHLKITTVTQRKDSYCNRFCCGYPLINHNTVKPVYNDHLMGYFSAFWSSTRWPSPGPLNELQKADTCMVSKSKLVPSVFIKTHYWINHR